MSTSPPKKAPRKPVKRPYLSRDDRRQKLLETAAEIVEQDGWPALNMSALAERGGTSRQLIYQHFPNLDALLAKTAWYIFNDTIEGSRDSILSNPKNLAGAVNAAEAVTLDLPSGRSDALWQLIAGIAGGAPELDQLRRGIRELITDLWVPTLREELGLDEDRARSTAWMLVMAFWGMRQLVRDGEISRDQGVADFNALITRLWPDPLKPPR